MGMMKRYLQLTTVMAAKRPHSSLNYLPPAEATSFWRFGFAPARGLSQPNESSLLSDGVVEVLLHCGQVRLAIKYKIGEAFAGQYILPRRGQHLVLVLRLDELERALAFGDVSHFSAMETDAVWSF